MPPGAPVEGALPGGKPCGDRQRQGGGERRAGAHVADRRDKHDHKSLVVPHNTPCSIELDERGGSLASGIGLSSYLYVCPDAHENSCIEEVAYFPLKYRSQLRADGPEAKQTAGVGDDLISANAEIRMRNM